MLFSSRLALGPVGAAASLLAASLIGDYFQSRERGRICSYILAGELVGVAAGFPISGNLAALISWHGAFFVPGALGFALAWIVWRKLPAPARGGSLAFDRRAKAASPRDDDAGPTPPHAARSAYVSTRRGHVIASEEATRCASGSAG